MKTHYYRTKLSRILFVIFLMAVSGASIANTAVTDAVDGIYNRAVAAYDSKDYKSALKQFRKMQKEFPVSKHAVRGWEYIAQCENVLGDKYAAFEAYQKIWDNHKNFNKLPTITRNQMKIADDFFKLKRYKIAIELYSKILENAPYSDSAAAAQYSIAHSMLGRENYFAAKQEFRKLIKNYPGSQFVDDAAFNLGYVDYLQSTGKEYDQTATTQAIAEFRQFIHEFPSSPNVYDAQKYIQKLRNRKAASLFRTGEFYENIRSSKAASISYREVIDQYPDTDYAVRARNRINRINDSKVARSEQAKQVVKMVQLGNQKELAHNRDIAIRRKIEESGKVEAAATKTYRKPVEVASMQLEQKNSNEVKENYANRIKELYMNPETREELRSTMKDEYLKERLRDKQTKAEWEQQKLIEQTTPLNVDKNQEPVEQASINSGTVQQKMVEEIAAKDIDYQPEVIEEIAEKNIDYQPETDQVIKEDEPVKIEEAKAEQSYNNETNFTSVDTGNEELSVEYQTVETPEETKTLDLKLTQDSQPEDVPKKEVVISEDKTDKSEFAIDTSELNDIVEKQEVEENKTPLKEEVEPKVEEQEIPQPEAEAKIEEQEISPPEAEAKVEVKVDDEVARVKEQEKADRLKKMLEYLKKKDKKEEIQTRKLNGVGNVRRATKSSGKESNSNALQRQYVGIYYSIQSGDSAKQRGITSDAERFYGKALDGLLDIKRKAPKWKSDIINWRIEYCRKELERTK
ncbi:MAG: hypothetical protein DRI44_02980 [Chlamydiae bacterium]|nr:MAG: hypothetical protein DRI44_02980 [Chlamydiota bacterium]